MLRAIVLVSLSLRHGELLVNDGVSIAEAYPKAFAMMVLSGRFDIQHHLALGMTVIEPIARPKKVVGQFGIIPVISDGTDGHRSGDRFYRLEMDDVPVGEFQTASAAADTMERLVKKIREGASA